MNLPDQNKKQPESALDEKIDELEELLETKSEQEIEQEDRLDLPVLDELVDYRQESVLRNVISKPVIETDDDELYSEFPETENEQPVQYNSHPNHPEPGDPEPEYPDPSEPEFDIESIETEQEPAISKEQLSLVLDQVENKIASELDSLVAELKSTLKDNLMSELKSQLASEQAQESPTEAEANEDPKPENPGNGFDY